VILFVIFLVAAAVFGVGGVANGWLWLVLFGVTLFYAAVIRGLAVSNRYEGRPDA
jgi:hypothetical protein